MIGFRSVISMLLEVVVWFVEPRSGRCALELRANCARRLLIAFLSLLSWSWFATRNDVFFSRAGEVIVEG